MSSELKFKIRSSFRSEISFLFDCCKTVIELKDEIAKVSGVETSNQRLIYKGRVLKNSRTLKSYKVEKDKEQGVKITLSTLKRVQTTQGSNIVDGTKARRRDPFMGMDPKMMKEMMNNPMVKSMMSNPEFMKQAMMMNPEMKKIVEKNPQVAEMLSDPDIMKQAFEISSNPDMLDEMMKNQDRAFNNITSLPGGFDALLKLNNDLIQPLHDATREMARDNMTEMEKLENKDNLNQLEKKRLEQLKKEQQEMKKMRDNVNYEKEGNINKDALPNPWGAETQNQVPTSWGAPTKIQVMNKPKPKPENNTSNNSRANRINNFDMSAMFNGMFGGNNQNQNQNQTTQNNQNTNSNWMNFFMPNQNNKMNNKEKEEKENKKKEDKDLQDENEELKKEIEELKKKLEKGDKQ